MNSDKKNADKPFSVSSPPLGVVATGAANPSPKRLRFSPSLDKLHIRGASGEDDLQLDDPLSMAKHQAANLFELGMQMS